MTWSEPLKRELRAAAARLGFVALGVAEARPFAAEREVLLRRRRLGLESPFEPQDVERRCSPQRVLPGARSLVVAAASYYRPYPVLPGGERGGPPRGVVARYAWGEDYHGTLRERLLELARLIERRVPGARCAVLVDTGPLVERAAAARAGVGWIGRNCCLIVPGAGSWVLLGEVVTTVPLPPDPPLADGCGDCDRCLRTCPTGALAAPGVLDHRRCLSYATQMKGAVPRGLRPALGRRVWGCDTCQEVCPHNRRRALAWTAAAGAPPDPERVRPRLAELACLDGPTFRRAWAATAAGWRGRHVLRRNALVALGNARHPATLPVLAAALRDPRPELRLHAAWALGRFLAAPALGAGARAAAHAALARALAAEGDADVRAELAAALASDGRGERPEGRAAAAAGPAGRREEVAE